MPDAQASYSYAPDVTALVQQGLALHRTGQLDQAVEIYQKVLTAAPDTFDALHLLGVVHLQRGDAARAAELIGQAISINARQPAAHGNLASALIALRDFTGAIESCDRALALKPDDVEAFFNRATALRASGQAQAALANFNQALALQSRHVQSLVGRGALLRDGGQPEAALVDFDAALLSAPHDVLVQYNRGNALKDLNRVSEAEAAFRQAIALNPDFAEAHVALAECLHLAGHADDAWPEYEWRWRTKAFASIARDFNVPRWNGRDEIGGKTILIHSEQGLGDTVQFARYASAVASLGAKVVLEVQSSLTTLLTNLAGVSSVIAHGTTIPAVDLQCPLMSLPSIFSSVPSGAAYLKADPNKGGAWKANFGVKAKSRIGIVWSGSTTHANDARRSIALIALAPLLATNAEFFSLQKDARQSDRAALANFRQLKDLSQYLHDMADTAAIMSELDLIISVDTVTAHLAGALGKPVWILLPRAPDWRWGLERANTDWYPSARLYRQSQRGDWASVIARVAADLKSFAL